MSVKTIRTGYDDGSCTMYLRRRYPNPSYSGIELEVNQKYPLGPPQAWRAMRRGLRFVQARPRCTNSASDGDFYPIIAAHALS